MDDEDILKAEELLSQGTISFDATINSDVLKQLIETEPQETYYSLGVDYGNGDIQSVGLFKLLPSKIKVFKRTKKGKRFIISSYEINNEVCLEKVLDKEN